MGSRHCQTFRALLRMLRAKFPVSRPVTVRRVKRLAEAGLTHFDERAFRIYISSKQSWDAQKDTLLHEWSHVVAIDEACQHKGRWGELHGEIYQAWESWDSE